MDAFYVGRVESSSRIYFESGHCETAGQALRACQQWALREARRLLEGGVSAGTEATVIVYRCAPVPQAMRVVVKGGEDDGD